MTPTDTYLAQRARAASDFGYYDRNGVAGPAVPVLRRSKADGLAHYWAGEVLSRPFGNQERPGRHVEAARKVIAGAGEILDADDAALVWYELGAAAEWLTAQRASPTPWEQFWEAGAESVSELPETIGAGIGATAEGVGRLLGHVVGGLAKGLGPVGIAVVVGAIVWSRR